jgi:hypothetical protein
LADRKRQRSNGCAFIRLDNFRKDRRASSHDRRLRSAIETPGIGAWPRSFSWRPPPAVMKDIAKRRDPANRRIH